MTIWRAVRILLAAVAYVVIAKVSQVYFVGPEVSAFFWPPSGFMLAMFLLSPRREWAVLVPVFFAANAVANIIDGDRFVVGLGFGTANTVESLAAAWLLTRFLPAPLTMTKLREVIALVGLACLVSNALTALVGATVVNYFFHAPFVPAWRVWWAADSVGMLLVTPVMVTWAVGGLASLRSLTGARALEAVALLGGMTAVTLFVFLSEPAGTSILLPLPYTTFPFLLWAAVRFGPRGGSLVSLAMAVMAVFLTVKGFGPFDTVGDSTTQKVLSVQAFIGIGALCAMMLAAVMNELRLSDEALRVLNAGLEERIRERTKELARSNAELEQFAYAASHDLQEPLRAVAGTTQMLQQRYGALLDDKGNELIRHAVSGATRMKTLINDLLAFARVGAKAAQAREVDCNFIIKEVLVNLAMSVSESNAAVTFEGLPTVRADPTQLVQLFQNLIGNAIKFRGEHRPEIQIRAERLGNEVKFAVTDNGIGIEAQYLDQVFGVFQRLDTGRDYPGNGIGLAICKKIVEYQGGRIWAESEPGRGTSFFFTFPSAPPARA